MSHLKKGDAFPLQPTPLFPLAYRTTRSIVLGIKSTPQKELYIYVFSGTEEISIGMYFEGVYPGRWNIGLNRGELTDTGALTHTNGSTFWQVYLKLVIVIHSHGFWITGCHNDL